MNSNPVDQEASQRSERTAAFWRKVYIAVVLNTIVVIAALWGFSSYFN